MRKLQTYVLLAVAAAIGGLLVVQYLRLLKPAQAREVSAACNGLQPSPVNSALDHLDGKRDGLFKPPIKAPDFTVQDHEGNLVTLSSFEGRVVVLNFWASWCAVCKSEKPSLETFQGDFDRDDVVVLALASDRSWSDVQGALPTGSPLQVYLDPPVEGDTLGTIARTYGVTAVPETFVIDRKGFLHHYFVNKRDWSSDVVRTCIRSFADR